jgi:acyl-CoA hydrolase
MNADPQNDWRARVVSPDHAIECVRPGDRVFVGSACATPRTLLRALEDRSLSAAGVQLVHFLTSGGLPNEGSQFRHRIFYVGTEDRSLVATGQAEYVPVSLAEVPGLMRSGRLQVDVALVQVSPPDDDGMCSLGVSVDVTKEAVATARTVVAEVNPHMPRTCGDSLVRLDRLDWIVAVDLPVIEYAHPAVEAVAERIAEYVARIIDDGSTLQIGLGRVPNEMLRYGGKAIVCLASTQPDGSSAIRPTFTGNEVVVIPRAEMRWVVTEYGITYLFDASTGLADVAYMVDSAWHGVGLGSALQARAIEYARGRGVRGFTADVLWSNAAMLHVLERAAATVTVSRGHDSAEVVQLFA